MTLDYEYSKILPDCLSFGKTLIAFLFVFRARFHNKMKICLLWILFNFLKDDIQPLDFMLTNDSVVLLCEGKTFVSRECRLRGPHRRQHRVLRSLQRYRVCTVDCCRERARINSPVASGYGFQVMECLFGLMIAIEL